MRGIFLRGSELAAGVGVGTVAFLLAREWRRRTGIEPARPRCSASPVLKTGAPTRTRTPPRPNVSPPGDPHAQHAVGARSYTGPMSERPGDSPAQDPAAGLGRLTSYALSLIHISEPTRRHHVSRMPSSA